MREVCFLSMDSLEGYVADDDLAIGPLTDLGWRVSTLSWRQSTQAWSYFDAVIIRTTWDYQRTPSAFLNVLEAISASTRLENPLSVVRWNLEKTYLRTLQAAGVSAVKT